jgi:hypothetical protein
MLGIIKETPFRFGHQFTVEFQGPDLPEYLKSTGVNDNITYYVRSASIPKVDVKSANVSFLAAGFVVPGVIEYPEDWQVEILLDQDLTMYRRLKMWHEEISSYRLDGGGKKVIPHITANVNLLDNTMQNIVRRYIMEGVWISELSNVDFKYQEGASDTLKCTAKFVMQYFYEAQGERDPLAGR